MTNKAEKFRKLIVFGIISVLMVSAFFVRLENFKNSRSRSIDEIVYYRMAKQMLVDPSDYNTIAYGQELAAGGRELPEYFFDPLFKHPPVFTALVTFSMYIFGESLASASYPSLLAGVLLILLAYLLGSLVYSRWVGFLAAVIMWMDPITILSSQKVWMDTTIAFFSVLSLYFYIYAFKNKKDWFFILSGIAGGLAVNTKYTGVLITFAIGVSSVFYARHLFRKSVFLLSLCLPFMLLVPWILWNVQIYGSEFLSKQIVAHIGLQKLINMFNDNFLVICVCLLVLWGTVYFLVLHKKADKKDNIDHIDSDTELRESNEGIQFMTILSVCIVLGLCFYVIPTQIKNAFSLTHIPTHSWAAGFFSQEPASFYFGRLVEYSLIFLFAFIMKFLFHPFEKKEESVLRWSSVIILVFFTFWGGFQSRYVLSAIPILIVLGSQLIVQLFNKINKIDLFSLRIIAKFLLICVVILMFYRTNMINLTLSFPNNTCYF